MTQQVKNNIAKILGVSEDSISALPKEITDSMQAVLENVEVRNEDDANMLYAELDGYWTKGNVLNGLNDVSRDTGIDYTTLVNLDYDTQQELVFEYMADSSNTAHLYDVVNKALAVMELENVAELTDIPVNRLKEYPFETQVQLCGMYSMEYDENNSFELISRLKGVIGL